MKRSLLYLVVFASALHGTVGAAKPKGPSAMKLMLHDFQSERARKQAGHRQGHYGRRTVHFKYRERRRGYACDSDIRLRAKLSPFFGEPVERYEFNLPRTVESIYLDADGGYRNRVKFVAARASKDGPFRLRPTKDGFVEVYVAQEIMDRLRVIDFQFKFGLKSMIGRGRRSAVMPCIRRRNPGLLSKPGQWGWDVPGSPDWRNMFQCSTIPIRGKQAHKYFGFLLKEHAQKKSIFPLQFGRSAALRDYRTGEMEVFDIEVSVAGILEELAARAPAIYRAVMQRSSRGSRRDAQMNGLIDGVVRRATQIRATGGGGPSMSKLDRRVRLINEAMGAFSKEVSTPTRQYWRQAVQQVEDTKILERMKTLQRRLAGEAENEAKAPSSSLRDEVKALTRWAGRKGSKRVRQKVAGLKRLVDFKPFEVTSHRDGQVLRVGVSSSKITEAEVKLAGKVYAQALPHILLEVNGKKLKVPHRGGRFSKSLKLPSGVHQLRACAGLRCTPLKLTVNIEVVPFKVAKGDLFASVSASSCSGCLKRDWRRGGSPSFRGTVFDPRIRVIHVSVNGRTTKVPVENGEFYGGELSLRAGSHRVRYCARVDGRAKCIEKRKSLTLQCMPRICFIQTITPQRKRR